MKEKTHKKGKLKKLLAIIVPVVVILGLGFFVSIWYWGKSYPEFDAVACRERPIPGLDSGLSPQGLCPLPEESGFEFAMSGYISGEASRVYFIGETEKYVTLKQDGKVVKTHFGGITCAGDSLYIASGKGVIQISLSDALATADGGEVEVTGEITAKLRGAAYCYYADGTLYIGEFYRPGNYETDESHHMTENGETNYALVWMYRETEDGFEEEPYAAISVREQVQGIAVWADGIALSTSYGLPDSTIWFHKNVLNETPHGEFEGVPLYRLDSTNLVKTLRAPCMSEEIFVGNGRIYILFESLSKKYRYFVRRRVSCIYSIPLKNIL